MEYFYCLDDLIVGRISMINIIIISIKRKTIGCAASSMVQCGIAMTAKIPEIQNSIHACLSSPNGSFHANLNVAIEPYMATDRPIIMPATASWKRYHRVSPSNAPIRPSTSRNFHSNVPNLIMSATMIHCPSTAPTIWPLIECFVSIPAKVTVSTLAQIIHVITEGFADPCFIANAYLARPMMHNTNDNIERTSFITYASFLG